jgi:hypothetical protein
MAALFYAPFAVKDDRAFSIWLSCDDCRDPKLLIRLDPERLIYPTFWQVGYITSKIRSLAGRVFERGSIERSLLRCLLPLLLLALIAFLAGR